MNSPTIKVCAAKSGLYLRLRMDFHPRVECHLIHRDRTLLASAFTTIDKLGIDGASIGEPPYLRAGPATTFELPRESADAVAEWIKEHT